MNFLATIGLNYLKAAFLGFWRIFSYPVQIWFGLVLIGSVGLVYSFYWVNVTLYDSLRVADSTAAARAIELQMLRADTTTLGYQIELLYGKLSDREKSEMAEAGELILLTHPELQGELDRYFTGDSTLEAQKSDYLRGRGQAGAVEPNPARKAERRQERPAGDYPRQRLDYRPDEPDGGSNGQTPTQPGPMVLNSSADVPSRRNYVRWAVQKTDPF